MLFLFLDFIKLNFEEQTGFTGHGVKKWTGLQDLKDLQDMLLGLS